MKNRATQPSEDLSYSDLTPSSTSMNHSSSSESDLKQSVTEKTREGQRDGEREKPRSLITDCVITL